MYKARSRQKDIFLRVTTYFLMSGAAVILAVVSVFLVLGYVVDEKTGQPSRGGLIQFRTSPDGAKVTIDKTKLSATTPSKANAEAGPHQVTFIKNGYRSWSKQFELDKGELLWLNALLVPSSITTQGVHLFEGIASIKASPDKKWVAVFEGRAQGTMTLVDISNEKKPIVTRLVLPASIYTPPKTKKQSDSFQIVEWDQDNRYLLVKHNIGKRVEWLRLDRTSPERAINIDQSLSIGPVKISDIRFSRKSANDLYLLVDGRLTKAKLQPATLQTPVVTNVLSFKLYRDDRLVYVAGTKNTRSVGYFKEGLSKPAEVVRFSADTPVQATLNSYYNDQYVAVSRGKNIMLIKNPLANNQKIIRLTFTQKIKWLNFSQSGRFIVAQNGSDLLTYDIERDRQYVFSIPGNPGYSKTEPLRWLDDFHLWSDVKGKLIIMDFDGSNPESIGTVAEGHDVTLSNNNKRLFSVGSTSTGSLSLQSSIMDIE